jgi:hypothetical protein
MHLFARNDQDTRIAAVAAAIVYAGIALSHAVLATTDSNRVAHQSRRSREPWVRLRDWDSARMDTPRTRLAWARARLTTARARKRAS